MAHARAWRAAYSMDRLEAFAEAVSDLNTVRAAANFVGVSERTGERYMSELCRRVGAQAR